MKRVNGSQRRPVSLLEGLEGRRMFAVNYSIVDLAPDTGGNVHTGEAYGISDNGKIAGQYDGNAAWWSADGTVHDLGFDGWAVDINDNGVVCGVDRTGGVSQPFVWKNGTKTILSLDGNTNGVATAINDDGTVVGSFFQTGIARKSFRAPLGGSAVNIGAPAGFEFVDATGINDNGQIIGEVYSTDAGYKAFIKSGGTFKLLGPLPGGSTTHAGHGIKNNGDIAIWGPSADLYNESTKVYHAYVVTSNGYGPIQDKGTYSDSFYDIDASDINSSNVITGNNNPGLNDEQGMINRGSGFDLVQNQISPAAGWTRIFSANQVNDSGRVVGEGFNSLGQRSPYVLIPIASGKSISGTLWNDSDADGVKDASESASGVRTVFIDANGNGKLDGGEKQTNSNASGQYTFSGLADGTYKISRVFPDGYSLSNGTGGAPYVTVNLSGANVSNVNLGSRVAPVSPKGSISGVLWNDSDADGNFDGSESTSGVRQVFIDTNGNKKLDAGELSTYSDSTGKYKFSNLAGGTYKVTRVFPSGYKLSNNSLGYITVMLATGQNKTGINLGSRTA